MNFSTKKSTPALRKSATGNRSSFGNRKWIWLILALPLIIFLIPKKEHEKTASSKEERTAIPKDHLNPDLWNGQGPFSGFSPKAELVSFRDKNAKHFPNEEGTQTAIISAGSVHYEAADGSWQEIDPKLTMSSRAGFSYENTTNGIKSWYPNAKGKKAVLMEVKGQQLTLAEKMELSWVDTQGKVLFSHSAKFRDPVVKDNILVYPSFFPGIKNEFKIGHDYIKNMVILDQKPDAQGDYLILKEQLSLPEGWKVQVNDQVLKGKNTLEGGFELVDEDGLVQLYIPAPEVFDQNENSRFHRNGSAKWILEQNGFQLNLKMQVEQSWLQHTDRKYPVILDPTVTITGFNMGSLTLSHTDDQKLMGYDWDEVWVGAFKPHHILQDEQIAWMQFKTGSIPNSASISQVLTKLGYQQKPNTGFFFRINDVSGPYGNYNKSQFDDVWNDLWNGNYKEIDLSFDSDRFFKLDGNATQDLQGKLPTNRFQYGITHKKNGPQQHHLVTRINTALRVQYCLPFTITEQPGDVSTCIDGNASFSTTINGNDQRTYQWFYSSDNGSTWNTLDNGGTAPQVSGAVSSSLNMSNIPEFWDSYLFRVTASSNCALTDDITSNSAKLTLGIRPTRIANPDPATACAGDEVNFTASFADAASLLWQESDDNGGTWTDMSNSTDVSGVNTSTLTLSNVPTSFSGKRYRLSATNCRTVYSFGGILTVNTSPTANTHPSDQSTNGGGSASFSASFNNAASVNWVYTTDGGSTWNTLNDGGSNPTISGATTNTLSLSNVPDSWSGREFALSGVNPSCPPVYSNRSLLEITNSTPVAKCKNINLESGSSCIKKIQASQIDNGSYDPDGNPITLSLDVDEFSYGTHTVILTVSDGELTDQCTAEVTIEDKRFPTARCKDATLQLDENGQASLTPDDINNGSSDNCGIAKMEITKSEFDCSNLGSNTVWLKVNDTSGNPSTCSATVTVKDNIAPVARCKNLSVPVDAQGMATITAQQVDNGSSDACGIKSLSLDKTSVTCADPSVTLTVIDNNNNSSTCSANLIFVDKILPVPDVDNLRFISGQCSASVSQAPTATDNCEGTITGTTNDPLTYTEQGTYSITWTYDDGNGNVETQTQTVIVDDVTAPVPNQYAGLPVYLSSIEGECEVSVDIAPTATDNCAGQITGTTTDPLYYDQQGIYQIRWTYDDGNGNQFVQFQNVIVQDETAPTALCQNLTIQLEDDGQATLLPSMINNGSFDACSPISMKVGQSSSDFSEESQPLSELRINCSMLGELNVYLLVVDASGNKSKCGALVTVEADGACDEAGGGSTQPWPPFPRRSSGGISWLKYAPGNSLVQSTELQAYPNPFQANLTVRFKLSETAKTSIEVFNYQGQRVRSLLSAEIDAGEHQRAWDGRDQNGAQLPSGMYLIQLRTGKEVINKKILLQR